jgi:hypothetical protein
VTPAPGPGETGPVFTGAKSFTFSDDEQEISLPFDTGSKIEVFSIRWTSGLGAASTDYVIKVVGKGEQGLVTITVPLRRDDVPGVLGIPLTPGGDREVSVRYSSDFGTGPVTFSIHEFQGSGKVKFIKDGAEQDTLTIDYPNTVHGDTFTIRGKKQTDERSPRSTQIEAERASTVVGRSPGFSVCAWPIRINAKFNGLLVGNVTVTIPGEKDPVPVWGAEYVLTADSDSGKPEHLDGTYIVEIIDAQPGTGAFAGLGWAKVQDTFIQTTRGMTDWNGFAKDSGKLQIAIKAAHPRGSRYEATQFVRFACRRSGVEENKGGGPVVPDSGFRIVNTTKWDGKNGYDVLTRRTGKSVRPVGAGTVDDSGEKTSPVR